MESLRQYQKLLDKLDALCRRIELKFARYIACRPGCHGCCSHLSVFPVEAVHLSAALSKLSKEAAHGIRDQALVSVPGGDCPLLEGGLCLLYQARPIICRTQGLPLMYEERGRTHVDFCPSNFQGLSTIPGESIIDLDKLNSALAMINALFLVEMPGLMRGRAERLTIAEALLL